MSSKTLLGNKNIGIRNDESVYKVERGATDANAVKLRTVSGQPTSTAPTIETAADLERKKELAAKMDFAYPELIAMLLLFPSGLSSGVFTNLLMETLCLSVSNMTEANCSEVNMIPAYVQDIIQHDVNKLLLWKLLIETLLPALCVLFLGPWSDAHGRRPLILMSIAGFAVSYMTLTFQALYKHLPVYYYLIAAIPIGLTGGFTVFFLSVICFISDITTLDNRATKMGTFEAGCMLGTLLSQLLTAKVSRGPNGFRDTFLTSAIACCLNFMYVLLFIPESAKLEQSPKKVPVIDIAKTFVKRRPNYNRALLYIIIIANLSYIMIIFGESDIFYQSTIKRFHWNLEHYSAFNSVSIILSGFVLTIGPYVTRLLKLQDMMAAALVIAPRVFSSLLYAFAQSGTWLYVGSIIGSVATLITPYYRSAISKIVPSHEIGKIFAVIMFAEALLPFGSSTVYTVIYNSTFETYPGTIFFFSFFLALTGFILFSTANLIHYRYPPTYVHTSLENETINSEADSVPQPPLINS